LEIFNEGGEEKDRSFGKEGTLARGLQRLGRNTQGGFRITWTSKDRSVGAEAEPKKKYTTRAEEEKKEENVTV